FQTCLALLTVGYDGPLMENLNPKPWTRHHVPANKFGLTGMDHAALAVQDVERAVRFYREALGAEVYYAPGLDERGRVAHVFMHVCTVLPRPSTPMTARRPPIATARATGRT